MTDAEGAAAHRALADAMAGERARIVASLIRVTGDWDVAEDAVADAAERALRRWPRDGVPRNPAAWLTTTARRRAIDVMRRGDTERANLAEVAVLDDTKGDDTGHPSPVTDDRLRLIFTCCHPALPLEARVALTLKVVCGLSMEAVGRAFLTSEPTMSQRLLRAKRKIANAGIPYRVPAADALPERLDGVLAVVYLVFTHGWAANADDALAEEAIRLGRLLLELMPDSDETRGLLALMLLQHSRRAARMIDTKLITLERQDRTRWDARAIAEAVDLLNRPGAERGPYRIQAELAALHATAREAADTDWPAIVTRYDELLRINPSPFVSLNRAVAVGMADGPLAGLAELDTLTGNQKLDGHHLLHAARGELLARAGRSADAAAELDLAAALAPTETERRQLAERRAEIAK